MRAALLNDRARAIADFRGLWSEGPRLADTRVAASRDLYAGADIHGRRATLQFSIQSGPCQAAPRHKDISSAAEIVIPGDVITHDMRES
jgi:hypothetical protein